MLDMYLCLKYKLFYKNKDLIRILIFAAGQMEITLASGNISAMLPLNKVWMVYNKV